MSHSPQECTFGIRFVERAPMKTSCRATGSMYRVTPCREQLQVSRTQSVSYGAPGIPPSSGFLPPAESLIRKTSHQQSGWSWQRNCQASKETAKPSNGGCSPQPIDDSSMRGASIPGNLKLVCSWTVESPPTSKLTTTPNGPFRSSADSPTSRQPPSRYGSCSIWTWQR